MTCGVSGAVFSASLRTLGTPLMWARTVSVVQPSASASARSQPSATPWGGVTMRTLGSCLRMSSIHLRPGSSASGQNSTLRSAMGDQSARLTAFEPPDQVVTARLGSKRLAASAVFSPSTISTHLSASAWTTPDKLKSGRGLANDFQRHDCLPDTCSHQVIGRTSLDPSARSNRHIRPTCRPSAVK